MGRLVADTRSARVSELETQRRTRGNIFNVRDKGTITGRPSRPSRPAFRTRHKRKAGRCCYNVASVDTAAPFLSTFLDFVILRSQIASPRSRSVDAIPYVLFIFVLYRVKRPKDNADPQRMNTWRSPKRERKGAASCEMRLERRSSNCVRLSSKLDFSLR